MKFFRFSSFAALIFLSGLAPSAGSDDKTRTVLFFGDSVTAGFGVDRSETYPALIQKEIEELGWPFRVVNGGLSGDTTAAGEQRLRWMLRQKVDVLVLALGGNDGLRGVPPETTRANLQRMINLAREKQPEIKIILAGMKMPPNYGRDYTARFSAVFPDLAVKNKIPLVPFLLEGVGGVSEMNLPDRIHPTAEGHALIAETVWKTLRPVLSGLVKS